MWEKFSSIQVVLCKGKLLSIKLRSRLDIKSGKLNERTFQDDCFGKIN